MHRIAICFFGITRSLNYTISSIEKNILQPANSIGDVRIFSHFFRQVEIDNPRSGEKGLLRLDEHLLLNPDWLQLEDPDKCLSMHGFEALTAYGDSWRDDFRSLRNLVHQLHSLERVTSAALNWHPDLVIFARPDLRYEDNLGPTFEQALRVKQISLPNWQRWRGGYNDRFAIASDPLLAHCYGTRVTKMVDYCREHNSPLHAELLLKFALRDHSKAVKFRPFRASRVRLDGRIRNEDFTNSHLLAAKKFFQRKFRRFPRWGG